MPHKSNHTDTITAIATPHGVGGIAVVRLSGPEALAIARGIWRGKELAMPRRAYYGEVAEPGASAPLDQCVATYFQAPASFTGEDTVEFAVHGSRWVQRELVRLLIARGARMALPGEFTQRAFLNGRIDLAQSEAVADLIAAESKAAHTLAMSQMKGNFSREIDALRDKLIEFASLLELELDFSEEDVEFADRRGLMSLCTEVKGKVDSLSATFRDGNAFKEGIPTVLAGIPNAGKSTLLNRLLGEEKAIVSHIPGTTRDLIDDYLTLEGLRFRLTDTAGLREASDEIERIGVDRAKEAMAKASIVIWLLDPTADVGAQVRELESACSGLGDNQEVIPVLTKSDAASPFVPLPLISLGGKIRQPARLSAKTGEGIEPLKEAMVAAATRRHDPETDILVTNERHYASLVAASAALARVTEGLAASIPTDFVAQDLREAIRHLSELTGSISSEDLLHTIFSRFCIGK